ncbi:MAG TPA: ABC transporter permease [Anaerolineales bacterium]|nr:ABC transporter permease [Anaerolineales bacterium]
MRILTLALKDMKQNFQSPQTAFFLLIMPVIFTIMFGFMFGGFGGDSEEDLRLPIAVLDQDSTSLSQAYTDLVERSDVIRPVLDAEMDETELRQAVSSGEYAGALLIPAGFEAALIAGDTRMLTLITEDNSPAVEISIKNALMSAYGRLFNASLAASISQQTYEQRTGTDEGQAYYDEGLQLALTAWETPPIEISYTYTGTETDEEASAMAENAFIHSSPGMMAQFAIAGLIGAAEILVSERRTRSLQRMLTTGISRIGILLGHYLAMTAVIFLQLLILAVFGQLFLKLDYFAHPAATLLVLLASAMATGAMGLLIGALAKTSETVVVYSLIPMFIFSGLGGAWTPLEFASDTVVTISKFTPVAWTINALKDILGRGLGMEAVMLPVLVLLGFTVLFFSLGAWAFKFE